VWPKVWSYTTAWNSEIFVTFPMVSPLRASRLMSWTRSLILWAYTHTHCTLPMSALQFSVYTAYEIITTYWLLLHFTCLLSCSIVGVHVPEYGLFNLCLSTFIFSIYRKKYYQKTHNFISRHTNGHAYATVCPSVCCFWVTYALWLNDAVLPKDCLKKQIGNSLWEIER